MTSREKKYLNKKKFEKLLRRPTEMFITSNGLEYTGGIICDGCGLPFDQDLMLRCENGDDVEWLCPDCNDGTSYCMGCGQFSAGITSFEFGDLPGYCDNCKDEIRSNNKHDEDEYSSWDECGFE